MEQQIADLENLNYGLISFIDTVINNEHHSIERGKHILLRDRFIREFGDILDKKKEQESEKEYDELEIDIQNSDDEPFTEKKKTYFKPKMIGGSTIEKKRKVEIRTANNKIHKYTPKKEKKTNKKDQIERRMKRIKANEVREIGKEFNLKPEAGKKYLTKDQVIAKITRNTRLYSKVLNHIKENYSDVVTENS